MVPLEALLPHLGPKDEDAKAAIGEAGKKLEEAVKKIGLVSLSQGPADKVCCKILLSHMQSRSCLHGNEVWSEGIDSFQGLLCLLQAA